MRPDVRQDLRYGLGRALTGRDRVAIAALRSALAALDNAEAVEVPDRPDDRPGPVGDPHPSVAGSVVGLGAAEVARTVLTGEAVLEVVRREVSERRSAAIDYDRLGRGDRALRLRAEADVLAAYLPAPD